MGFYDIFLDQQREFRALLDRPYVPRRVSIPSGIEDWGNERQTQKTRWCLQGWYGSVLIEKWRLLPIFGVDTITR
jgi:hypothetical protein